LKNLPWSKNTLPSIKSGIDGCFNIPRLSSLYFIRWQVEDIWNPAGAWRMKAEPAKENTL
jgi:hypothetical protein